MKFVAVAVFAVALGLSAAANAATMVRETFDFTKDYVAGSGSTQRDTALTFAQGGLTLTVGAVGYITPSSGVGLTLSDDVFQVSQQASFGLYVFNDVTGSRSDKKKEDHRIDGYWNELVTFLFDKNVTVESITFAYARSGSHFDAFVGTVYKGSRAVGPITELNYGPGMMFGIGASKDHSAFKITGLTVSYLSEPPMPPVPLPASALLLVGALGGLGLWRRVSRKAA